MSVCVDMSGLNKAVDGGAVVAIRESAGVLALFGEPEGCQKSNSVQIEEEESG